MSDQHTGKPSTFRDARQACDPSIRHGVRCPECGHGANDPLPPRALSIFNWRISAPFIAVVIAIAVVVTHISATSNTQAFGPTSAPGASTPWSRASVVFDPAISHETLLSIQRGHNAAAGERLFRHVFLQAEQWFGWAPGEPKLQAAFVASPRERVRELTFGWPTAWWISTQVSTHPIAATDANPIPAEPTSPRESIGGGIRLPSQVHWDFQFPYVHRTLSPTNSNGLQVQSSIRLQAIALSLMIVIVLALAMSLLVWLIDRLRRRGVSSQFRRWRLPSAGLATCFVIWMALDTREDATHVYVLMTSATPASGARMVNTSLSERDILDLAKMEDRARTLASAILEATKSMDAGDDLCLATAVAPETYPVGVIMTSFSPDFLISFRQTYHFRQRPEFGPGELVAAPVGMHLRCRDGRLFMERTSGDPTLPTTATYVDLGILSMLVLGLAVLWLLVWAPLHWIDRHMIRRRSGRNQCIACGHALGPMHAVSSGPPA